MARHGIYLVMGAAAAAAALALGAGACGGGSATIGPASGDDGGNNPGTDSGSPGDDSGTITDGGSNIDPDAGGDAGNAPDGGKCNAVANTATAIASTCISKIPTYAGGALVTGKYHLTSVEALGSTTFCTRTFVPTGFKETILLTVTGASASAESVLELAAGAPRNATTVFTTTATNTTPMQAQETCPNMVAAAGPVPYTSAAVAATQTLALLLPYGKAQAVYTYTKAP
jgi:hypothetical protein